PISAGSVISIRGGREYATTCRRRANCAFIGSRIAGRGYYCTTQQCRVVRGNRRRLIWTTATTQAHVDDVRDRLGLQINRLRRNGVFNSHDDHGRETSAERPS